MAINTNRNNWTILGTALIAMTLFASCESTTRSSITSLDEEEVAPNEQPKEDNAFVQNFDLDQDGRVGISDLENLQYLFENEIYAKEADFDNDGLITEEDVNLLGRGLDSIGQFDEDSSDNKVSISACQVRRCFLFWCWNAPCPTPKPDLTIVSSRRSGQYIRLEILNRGTGAVTQDFTIETIFHAPVVRTCTSRISTICFEYTNSGGEVIGSRTLRITENLNPGERRTVNINAISAPYGTFESVIDSRREISELYEINNSIVGF